MQKATLAAAFDALPETATLPEWAQSLAAIGRRDGTAAGDD